MQKRSSNPRKDFNEIAARVVGEATGTMGREVPALPVRRTVHATVAPIEKNPAAVALGRLGGLKGGKARAERLTGEERSEIAKKAAAARWGKRE